MKKKNLTLAQRLDAASVRKTAALADFDAATAALDAAKAEHEAVADEAYAQIASLQSVAALAEQQAEHAARVADRVRALTA